jgi:transcriptional regulator with XRE-family HTH domain
VQQNLSIVLQNIFFGLLFMIGERIILIRTELRFTQKEFSLIFGNAANTISQWESGPAVGSCGCKHDRKTLRESERWKTAGTDQKGV